MVSPNKLCFIMANLTCRGYLVLSVHSVAEGYTLYINPIIFIIRGIAGIN